MSTLTPLQDVRVQELLARIGSNAVSPGAGAAGAIAAALAAACASKAASVSLKHRPNDPGLHAALNTFQGIIQAALIDAQRDAEAFEAVIHERDAAAIERLICEERTLERLISTLTAAIDAIAPAIQGNMAGDVVAARALATAALKIQRRNARETLELR